MLWILRGKISLLARRSRNNVLLAKSNIVRWNSLDQMFCLWVLKDCTKASISTVVWVCSTWIPEPRDPYGERKVTLGFHVTLFNLNLIYQTNQPNISKLNPICPHPHHQIHFFTYNSIFLFTLNSRSIQIQKMLAIIYWCPI